MTVHTNELPRITPEIRQTWQEAGLFDLAKKVGIGSDPSALRLGTLSPFGINVWQTGFPDDVAGFVTRSIELEERNAPQRLLDYFRQFEFIFLDQREKLMGAHSQVSATYDPVSSDKIVELYAHLSIDPAQVGAFANHVVDTLTQSMIALRVRGSARLQLEKTVLAFYSGDGFHWDHVYEAPDRKRKLSIPFTNPGRYFGFGYVDKEHTRRREFVATAPGDVCVQAAKTRYKGPSLNGGYEKTAFSLNFNLL